MKAKRYSIDLPRHMAQCDANYLRLQKIFPRLAEEDRAVIGLSDDGSRRVRLEVQDRSPYTTVILLAEEWDVGWQADPSLEPTIKVRLYHDARSAEVIEYQNEKRFQAVYEYPNRRMRHKDEKAQINRFLGEYLAHCLRHGTSVDEPAFVAQ